MRLYEKNKINIIIVNKRASFGLFIYFMGISLRRSDAAPACRNCDWFFSSDMSIIQFICLFPVFLIKMQEADVEAVYIVEPISRNHKNHINHSASLLSVCVKRRF